jgi:hypothetical protein
MSNRLRLSGTGDLDTQTTRTDGARGCTPRFLGDVERSEPRCTAISLAPKPAAPAQRHVTQEDAGCPPPDVRSLVRYPRWRLPRDSTSTTQARAVSSTTSWSNLEVVIVFGLLNDREIRSKGGQLADALDVGFRSLICRTKLDPRFPGDTNV